MKKIERTQKSKAASSELSQSAFKVRGKTHEVFVRLILKYEQARQSRSFSFCQSKLKQARTESSLQPELQQQRPNFLIVLEHEAKQTTNSLEKCFILSTTKENIFLSAVQPSDKDKKSVNT